MSSNLALDLIIKAIISSSDFQSQEQKPWDAISRLVPGTTADQVLTPRYVALRIFRHIELHIVVSTDTD